MSLQTAAEMWWSWILPVSVQAGILACVALLVDRVLRARAWPAVLTALWAAVLLRLVLPPDIASPWSLTAAAVARGRELFTSAAGGAARVQVANDASIASSSAWPAVLGSIWIAGVVVLAARDGLRARWLAGELAGAPDAPESLRFRARELAACLGIARTPRIVVSRRFASPALVGAVRVCVVLPLAWVDAGASADLEHALLHELGHVKRRDGLQALCVRVFQIVFWFHPAAWIAGRKLAEMRELGCDAAVARVLRERTPLYRDSLLRAAGANVFGRDWRGANASGFLSSPNILLVRLAWLERPTSGHMRSQRAVAAMLFVFLCACVLPMTNTARDLGSTLDPLVQQAFERLQRAAHSNERQNCLETQAASRVLIAHHELTGEDLFARIR